MCVVQYGYYYPYVYTLIYIKCIQKHYTLSSNFLVYQNHYYLYHYVCGTVWLLLSFCTFIYIKCIQKHYTLSSNFLVYQNHYY